MVYGAENDPEAKPLNVVDAAAAVGIKSYVLRRYFERPAVIALLRQERRAHREILCSSNEAALADVRDNSKNSMSRVAAVRALDGVNEDRRHESAFEQRPGFTIVIAAPIAAQLPVNTLNSPMIAVTPAAATGGEEQPAETHFGDD
jgi:hypothetical protein